MNPACTQYQDDWYRVTPGLMYWHNLVLDRSHFYCLFIIILTALGLGLSTPVWSLDVLELVNLSFSMRQVIWYLVWKDLENLFHHVLSEVNQYSSFKMCWSDGSVCIDIYTFLQLLIKCLLLTILTTSYPWCTFHVAMIQWIHDTFCLLLPLILRQRPENINYYKKVQIFSDPLLIKIFWQLIWQKLW